MLSKMSHEGPIAHHHNWLTSSHVPSGDRSAHEHFVISKVLEAAAEVDQLNLPTLKSFEMLGRRLQVIELAHAHSGSNADYTAADDLMGWRPQRGAALVAPAALRHAASKAKEKAGVMKERRKLGEEIELRAKQPKGPKGNTKGKKGAEQEE